MRVLVIGGTGFVGPHAVRRLAEDGHEVTVFRRGTTEADLPALVDHLLGDRARLGDAAADLRRLVPGVVLTLHTMGAAAARTVASALVGVARRLVAVSSIDVSSTSIGPPVGSTGRSRGRRSPCRSTRRHRLLERLFPSNRREADASAIVGDAGPPVGTGACRATTRDQPERVAWAGCRAGLEAGRPARRAPIAARAP